MLKRLIESGVLPRSEGARIALYAPLSKEIAVDALAPMLLQSGCTVCLPRLGSSSAETFEMLTWSGQTAHLEKGPYGILQPGVGDVVPPENLDFILVPGLLFGKQGERLGRGAGFYDRYLKRAPNALRISVCFDEQVRESLPEEPWDLRVNGWISDTQSWLPDA